MRTQRPGAGETLRRPGGYSHRDRNVLADDAILVRRCLREDPRAIRELIEQHQDAVFGLCMRLLRHRQDAEDATQEVFLRIFRSLKRWDAARPLKPWVLSITVNRCRTWLAKKARRPEPVGFLDETAAAAPEDDSRELRSEIDRALAGLKFEHRLAFVLFHEQGQPYEAIADALESPVGTVKTWLHRARLEVLDELQRRGIVDIKTDAPHGP